MAAKLRLAAVGDVSDASVSLKNVLEEYTKELDTKRFSAASTDKLLIDGEQHLNADREIVKGLMEEFVQHLGEHWAEDLAAQRHRVRRFGEEAVQIAADYFLHWDEFSSDWMKQIDHLGHLRPWPMLFVMVIPAIPFMLCNLVPFQRTGGWREQALYLACQAIDAAWVNMYFPIAILSFARIPYSSRALVKASAWSASVGMGACAASIAVAAALNTWPPPFNAMLAASTLALHLPLSWWMVLIVVVGVLGCSLCTGSIEAFGAFRRLLVLVGLPKPLGGSWGSRRSTPGPAARRDTNSDARGSC